MLFPDADGFRHPVVLYDGIKNLLLVPFLGRSEGADFMSDSLYDGTREHSGRTGGLRGPGRPESRRPGVSPTALELFFNQLPSVRSSHEPDSSSFIRLSFKASNPPYLAFHL